MARVLKPLAPLSWDGPAVFLAGSIEMGAAEPWQDDVATKLAEVDVTLLNPRRDAWDSSWTQRIDDERFRGQVEWELDGLARADVVAFYFAPTTRAPVTLLELGLTAPSGRVIVCCPDGFWRKGNVEVVCARFGVPLVGTLDELCAAVRRRLGR